MATTTTTTTTIEGSKQLNPAGNSVRSVTTSIKDEMTLKKTKERVALGENVFSLLIVAPVWSKCFMFACTVILLKLFILAILISDISFADAIAPKAEVTVVKFLLVPVAIAMQEDLMDSFYIVSNGIYCRSILDHSTSATFSKFIFGYIARTIDGILSLYVNYAVMLVTDDAISVFLNFAALQFIYEIDDVFFELITLGFFGDQMEHMASVCEDCSLSRRFGQSDYKIFGLRFSWLDSIFFSALSLILYAIMIAFTVHLYDRDV